MKKIGYILSLGTVLSCTACEEWLTIQPETTMAAELLFQTETGITQGLNGAYYKMLSSYRPTSNLGGSGFIEDLANTYYVDPLSGSDSYLYSIHSYNQSDSQKEVNKQTFMGLYEVIANLNSLLNEMVKNRESLNSETYKILCGNIEVNGYLYVVGDTHVCKRGDSHYCKNISNGIAIISFTKTV